MKVLPTTPNCPKCGTQMVLRNKKNDVNSKFWGCPKFPRCNGIVSYTSAGQYAEATVKQTLRRIAVPSDYQKAVFEWLLIGSGNSMVNAVAGSGKTTLLEHLCSLIQENNPSLEIVVLMYNSHIQKAAAERGMPAQTTHSLGLQAIKAWLTSKGQKSFPSNFVNGDKVRNIVMDLITKTWDAEKHLIGSVVDVVSKLKNTLAPTDDKTIEKITEKFNIETNGSLSRICELARKALELSNADLKQVDFDDMLYVPIHFNIPLKKYDWILADECFPYHTPVLMKDNQNLSIGEIVENKIEGEVLTFNTETGEQEYKKIINWHKLPNKKPLVRVLALQHVACMGGFRAAVTCTEDHRIWTQEKGWVQAKDLEPGMHIQGETSAKVTQKYKITDKGKKTLGKIISKNNVKGITGLSRVPKGTKFAKRGGNGNGLTVPQQLLLDQLGEDWTAECVVIIPKDKRIQYQTPSCYKVDIGNQEKRIAVELDRSLKAAKKKYAKKDSVLESMGWKVYRYENYNAVSNLDSIVCELTGTDCPVWCEVVSVEPITVKEYFVYDITVEDNHNFYANGVLVHNCQDLNRAQIQLVLRSIKPTGRVIVVGDRKQSIYGFRGAAIDAMDMMQEALKAVELPLSITYRCPKSHVSLVNRLFPHIPFEAAPNAIEGTINFCSKDKMLGIVQDGDLVLSRVNAALVGPVFSLIRRGIKAIIRGRDIGKGLISLIQKFEERATSVDHLIELIEDYKEKEVSRLLAKNKNTQAEALQDRVETLVAIADNCNSIREMISKIDEVFSDKKVGVVFSTVHRAKGDESDNVFILRPDLMPHPMAGNSGDSYEQELNCLYVALTRAKKNLTFIGQIPSLPESEELDEEQEVLMIESKQDEVSVSEIIPAIALLPVKDEITNLSKAQEELLAEVKTNEIPVIGPCPF